MGTFLLPADYAAVPIAGIGYVIQPWPTTRITTAYQPRPRGPHNLPPEPRRPWNGNPSLLKQAENLHRARFDPELAAILSPLSYENPALSVTLRKRGRPLMASPRRWPFDSTAQGQRLSNEAPLDKADYIRESTGLDSRGKRRVKEMGGYVHHAVKSERWWPSANLPPLSGRDLRDIGYYDEATDYFRADWQAKVESGADHCTDCGRSWRGASTGFGAYLRCHGILGENPQKVYLAGRPRTSAVSDNPKRQRVLRRYVAVWDERFRAWGHEQHAAGVDAETAVDRLLAGPFDRGIEAQVARETGVARRHVNRWVAEMLSTDALLLDRALDGKSDEPTPEGHTSSWMAWRDSAPGDEEGPDEEAD